MQLFIESGGGDEGVVSDSARFDGGHELKELAQFDLSVAIRVHLVQHSVHLLLAQHVSRHLENLERRKGMGMEKK